eukprot:80282-Chlamydomonas_euryale.AAC.1
MVCCVKTRRGCGRRRRSRSPHMSPLPHVAVTMSLRPQAGLLRKDAPGLRLPQALAAVAIGAAVRALPCPSVLSDQAWTLFAIFCSTVAGACTGRGALGVLSGGTSG